MKSCKNCYFRIAKPVVHRYPTLEERLEFICRRNPGVQINIFNEEEYPYAYCSDRCQGKNYCSHWLER